jgi:hypothetical protein
MNGLGFFCALNQQLRRQLLPKFDDAQLRAVAGRCFPSDSIAARVGISAQRWHFCSAQRWHCTTGKRTRCPIECCPRHSAIAGAGTG